MAATQSHALGDLALASDNRRTGPFPKESWQWHRLVPGAMATNFDPFSLNLSTTGQRVNGIRSNSLYFMVDGADNMDNGGNSNAIINPNIDTIAEVRILTASYAAEFGGRAGGMVNVVTKSGTREFHGSAFEYVRNNIFDARSFFAQTRPPLRFNNFGWTLGGPVYVPNALTRIRASSSSSPGWNGSTTAKAWRAPRSSPLNSSAPATSAVHLARRPSIR